MFRREFSYEFEKEDMNEKSLIDIDQIKEGDFLSHITYPIEKYGLVLEYY